MKLPNKPNMTKKNRSNWGGKRIGINAPATRPKKYEGKTVVIRVPIIAIPEIEEVLKKYVTNC
jgi:hypothetical protein